MHINGVTRIVSREDGPLEIPRGVVHGFSRAEIAPPHAISPTPSTHKANNNDTAWEKEDVIVLEYTSPADPLKEVLFRNGVSAFLANNSKLTFSLILRILVIMGTLDQFPMIFPWSKWLSWVVVHGFFSVVVPVLRTCGVRGWEREWTPRELWGVAESNEGGRKQKQTERKDA